MVDRGPKSIFGVEHAMNVAAETNKQVSGGALAEHQSRASMAAPVVASGRRKTKADISEDKHDLGKTALRWIALVTKIDLPCEDVDAELRDGIVLCKLANAIKPGSIKKFEEKSKLPFKLMENVSAFLRVARASFNLPEFDLFSTPDLWEGKNIPQVITTIHALGKSSATVQGFSGPFLERGEIVEDVKTAQSKQVSRISVLPEKATRSAVPVALRDPHKLQPIAAGDAFPESVSASAPAPAATPASAAYNPYGDRADPYSQAAQQKAREDCGKEEWRLREAKQKEQAQATLREMGGGGRGGRKLSRISKMEMIKLDDVLHKIFNKFSDGEVVSKFSSGKSISETAFVKFAKANDLIDNRFTDSDARLVFASVKIGKRAEIKFDRFQEAVRKVAVEKEVTYQEIIQDIEGDVGDL